ncbi:hypothetical protein BDV95DRAFT_15905 [Massariosphaeria phaeospora]|uniref:Uncharacterized protein n=1 Tax=Massariosphaeria phaeospora TaxID=100035 RepID=A0A7C8MYQ5_9PLEO|nr:hypothetical protein BDV95DRAFT_15905 [Massariosphaeria phaeospora]
MPVIPTVPEVSLPVVTTGSLAPTSEGQMSIPAGETPITTALNTVIPVIPTTIPEVSLPVVTTGSLAPTSVVTSTVSSVGSGTPGASTSASTSGPPESTGAAAPAHAGAGYSSLVVVALSGLCFTIGFAWTLL